MKHIRISEIQTIPLYFVESEFNIRGKRLLSFVERDASNMDHSSTVREIAEGQIENVRRVLEVIPSEGTCRDVTEDMARDVMNHVTKEPWAAIPEFLVDFLETQLGCATVAQVQRELAVFD